MTGNHRIGNVLDQPCHKFKSSQNLGGGQPEILKLMLKTQMIFLDMIEDFFPTSSQRIMQPSTSW